MSEENRESTPGKIDRHSTEAAKRVVEESLAQSEVRQAVLNLLVESIHHAHRTKDTSWGLTLHPHGVRLNVGPLEVFYFGRERGQSIVVLVADGEKLSVTDRKSLARLGVEFTGEYKSMPLSDRAVIAPETIPTVLPHIRDSYMSLVEKAARTVRTRTTWYETHSPGVTNYLRKLGYEIEEPEYTKWEEKGQSKGKQFAKLYDEFSSSYLDMDKGQKHLSIYESQRAEARRNYDDIVARKGRGEDVTDLVWQNYCPTPTRRAIGSGAHGSTSPLR